MWLCYFVVRDHFSISHNCMTLHFQIEKQGCLGTGVNPYRDIYHPLESEKLFYIVLIYPLQLTSGLYWAFTLLEPVGSSQYGYQPGMRPKFLLIIATDVCKQAELSRELFLSLSVFVPTFVGFELKKAAGVKQLMKVKPWCQIKSANAGWIY